MGFSPKSKGTSLIFLFLSLFSNPATSGAQSATDGFISAVISENGLVFVKDFLVEQVIQSLTPIRLPDIEKSVKIPILGGVHVSASDITLYHINVSSSTVNPGDTGIVIVASGASASLSLKWSYIYSSWIFVPIEVSDEGNASVQVEGLEVNLTIRLENKKGTLALNVTQCGCYMEDINITLDGGVSWLYQGFADAFEDQIRSAVENAITKKITAGTGKLDSLLQSLPKQINMANIAPLNVTFVEDPVVRNSSIEFYINGLFVQSSRELVASYLHKQSPVYSVYCGSTLKMVGISINEAVFDSASMVLFEEGLFHWIVDKVPDQSLLNTASWKFIIPQLYRKYPNDEMQLNISLSSAPVVDITQKGFVATIFLDMIVEVFEGNTTIPVACISVDLTISGDADISGNKLVSRAHLNDFSLSLKWSEIGNFRMFLVQGVMRVFLNTVVMPYINIHLRKGFSIPSFHGLALQNAQLVTTNSNIILCSDLTFFNSSFITDMYKA
ncbi:putative BPI/LBP family protein At1g04970 [Phalaenopsis equestris]|uniref:putative BPI/LBP family protein At1g04970 n=1 Tax=Phalaenopsis equestris TaxID=78828 RepID=UPI0009E3C309|nr:putative BPI/LBP family protein At1g04970 [Phalaenopsis equestris]